MIGKARRHKAQGAHFSKLAQNETEVAQYIYLSAIVYFVACSCWILYFFVFSFF